MKKASISLNLAAIVLSLVVGIALFEGGYRLWSWIKSPKTIKNFAEDAYDNKKNLYDQNIGIAQMSYDSYLAYIPKADFTGRGYHHNRDHFRYDKDFPTAKPADEIRIFATGGSTGWGVGVLQDATYARRLEERFAKEPLKSGKKVRVVIAAAGGWCTTQEKIMIQQRLLDFSPDVVLMLSGWNDTYFGYRGKPILQDNDFLGYRVRIEPVSTTLHPLDPPMQGNYDLKVHYLWDLLRYRRLYPTRVILEEKIRAGSLDPHVTIESLKRNVLAVADSSKRYHFKLVYALQPCVYSTKKPLTSWESSIIDWGVINEIGFPAYLKLVYATFRRELPAVARENAFTFIDVDEAIQPETRSVFADTVHLSDRGNQHIADFLYPTLRKAVENL